MTNVPSPSLTNRGYIAPQESDIVAGVLADFNDAFGGDLNTNLETPQGQLATSIAAVVGYANDQFLALANGVDPAFADGRLQDAIGRIYFLERTPSEPTTVQATCGGAIGTVIPVGALAQSADGNIYSATQSGTIGAAGTVILPFANINSGPVACPVGSLSTVYKSIPGWDSIINNSGGIPGRDTETREEFEARRAASVALNANGVLPAIRAAVLNVPNVLDAYVIDNPNSTSLIVGGVTLNPRSLFVSVSGGASADIARAIWQKKNPGCGYTGTTTINVTDTNSGYLTPPPVYPVTFTIASGLPVIFAVQLTNNANVPADASMQVKTAIQSAFVGGDGGSRASIGATLFASRFYGVIGKLGSWAQIVTILIGSPNNPGSSFTGSISGNTLTTSGGTPVIGQTLYGSGILANTVITGGSGTSWTVNKSQTVGSITIIGYNAALSQIIAHIDQVPTLNPDDISVSIV